eukprot:359205-Chlamydomonas_euryale.AAC.4
MLAQRHVGSGRQRAVALRQAHHPQHVRPVGANLLQAANVDRLVCRQLLCVQVGAVHQRAPT